MSHNTIEAHPRTTFGTGRSQQARQQGLVPAIIFGEKKPSEPILFDHKSLYRWMEQGQLLGHILQIKQGKKTSSVLVKAVQMDTFRTRILHLDCQRVHNKHPITTTVALRFHGEESCPAKKQQGQAIHQLTEVSITCLPQHLPDHIDVDVSHMLLDQVLHLSDIALPKGVQIAHSLEGDQDLPVLVFHPSKVGQEPAVQEPDSQESEDLIAEDTQDEDSTAQD